MKRNGSNLQGNEKETRALGTSTIGWGPAVSLENTSRRYTCRHHLGVASRNGERTKSLIILVKIFGKYYPDIKQITSIKITCNFISRLNCKHTLYYPGCGKKNYKFSGNKVANTSFDICYHLTRRGNQNPATTIASCNTLNNGKYQDNNCNSQSWSIGKKTQKYNKKDVVATNYSTAQT